MIEQNIYNKRTARSEPKLKVWRYAGLMLTYKCSAECRFCYYNCSPDSGGLMEVNTAISAWKSLIDLAGDDAKIHITGGEPFLYFDRLAEIAIKAKQLGLKGLDSIETNASWAADKKLISERIKLLDDAGMDRLKISFDPFHAEFIDRKNVELLAETASEIIGADRVMVRWEKYLQKPVNSPDKTSEVRMKEYIDATRDFPCRFTGRAAGELATMLADKTVEQIAETDCKNSFLGAKGVHIDPYGNVFSGLCSGIIVGNVNDRPLDEIWKNFDPQRDEFFDIVFNKSPAGMLNKAIENGYNLKGTYAGKCHLCTDIRAFFFDKGLLDKIIGPSDCYGRHVEQIKGSQ